LKETAMSDTRFFYVTYIRTSPERLWDALTNPEFAKQYWFGFHPESDWRPGASWKLIFPDGRVGDAGEVLEIDPPKRLVLSWRNEIWPELREDGVTRCTFLLEPDGGMVKLSVTHEAERPHGLIRRVAGGWPQVLSSLKSLLETGTPLARPNG
jgi:uncharacterized protein YndB with AHSA1/START domain